MTRTPEASILTTPRYRPGPHWAAVLAAVCTWPLLLVGGSVTVYRVGMAVPDWPTTFGVNMFLYDFLDSSWGVYLEHSHRLYGSVVGLACIVLAIWTTVSEIGARIAWPLFLGVVAASIGPFGLAPERLPAQLGPFFTGLALVGIISLALGVWLGAVHPRAVLGLSWLALAGVIAQGILGGFRVRLNSTDLAMVHGITAQLFFGLMVVLCVLTGRGWSQPRRGLADESRLRLHATMSLGLILVQMILGAWLRHHGGTAGLGSHAGLAALVIPYAGFTAWVGLRNRARVPELRASAWVMMVAVVLQLVLGVLAWYLLRPFDGIPRPVWPAQAAIRIAHQGIGALLIASATVLCLRAFRHLSPERPISPLPDSFTATPPTLETVA